MRVLSIFFAIIYFQFQSPVVYAQSIQNYYGIPIHIHNSGEPIAVLAQDGKYYLSYHLLLTNLANVDVNLELVRIKNNTNNILMFFSEEELSDRFKFRSTLIPGQKRDKSIKSADTGMLFFWISFESKDDIPDILYHDFQFELNENISIWNKLHSKGDTLNIDNYALEVSQKQPKIFSSPVRGKNWRVGNGPGYKTAHQFVVTGKGETRIPQRFAIDFQIVDEKGITLPTPLPKELTNKMFYAYKQHIYAVADGVVTKITDGIPENIPKANGAITTNYKMDASTVGGNHITLKVGEKEYVHYAHLVPGSIKIKEGDFVKNGDFLGLLGNSGNSTGPHLHFNFTDGIHENYSNGLPYVFNNFSNAHGETYKNQIPLNQSVINFNNQ